MSTVIYDSCVVGVFRLHNFRLFRLLYPKSYDNSVMIFYVLIF